MDVTLSRTPEFHLLKLSLSLLLVKSSYFFKLKPNIFSNFIVRTSAFNPGKNFCNFLHDPDFFLRIVENTFCGYDYLPSNFMISILIPVMTRACQISLIIRTDICTSMTRSV